MFGLFKSREERDREKALALVFSIREMAKKLAAVAEQNGYIDYSPMDHIGYDREIEQILAATDEQLRGSSTELLMTLWRKLHDPTNSRRVRFRQGVISLQKRTYLTMAEAMEKVDAEEKAKRKADDWFKGS